MAATILLADDSPHARRMGTQYLGDLGYAVEAVADGAAALAALERLRPRLILVDAGLPGLSGLELCRRVKAHPEWKDVLVLVMVGALARLGEGELSEADGVLRKPLSSAGLEQWLRAAPAPPAELSPQEMLVLAVQEAANAVSSEP